jgi:hypothetical protein
LSKLKNGSDTSISFEKNSVRDRLIESHKASISTSYQKKTILKGVFRFFLSKVFTYFFVILVRSLNILRSPLQTSFSCVGWWWWMYNGRKWRKLYLFYTSFWDHWEFTIQNFLLFHQPREENSKLKINLRGGETRFWCRTQHNIIDDLKHLICNILSILTAFY